MHADRLQYIGIDVTNVNIYINMNTHTDLCVSACMKSSVLVQIRLCISGLEQLSEQWTNEGDVWPPRHAPAGSGAELKSHVRQVSPRNAPAGTGAAMKSHARYSAEKSAERREARRARAIERVRVRARGRAIERASERAREREREKGGERERKKKGEEKGRK